MSKIVSLWQRRFGARTCAVCSTFSEHRQWGERPMFSRFNHYIDQQPRLDEGTLIGERYKDDLYIETCPGCGYCARNIESTEELCPALVSMVRSSRYQELLHRGGSVSLVNQLRCMALLQEVIGRLAEKAVALIWAAWEADDTGEAELARSCRSDAAELLLCHRLALRRLEKNLGSSSVVLSDLFRRAGRIEEAQREVDAALQRPFDPVVEMLLLFERQLCERGDTACHTEAEAFQAILGQPSPREQEPAYDKAAANYFQQYYSALLTSHEEKALKACWVRTLRGVQWDTDGNAVARKLLEGGKDALVRAIEQRLLVERPDKIFMNRCPRCGGLARTPQAKQCRHCGHSWRS